MDWSLQGGGGGSGGAGIIYKLAVESPWEYAMENRTELTRMEKMTSKVFSIFSVYDFVIIRSSLKCSSYGFSLEPETHKIIVRSPAMKHFWGIIHSWPSFSVQNWAGEKWQRWNKEAIGVYCPQNGHYYFSLYLKYLIKCKIFLRVVFKYKSNLFGTIPY